MQAMPTMASMETIGDRIRISRQAIKKTQADLADHLGIKRPNVTQWETNITKPDRDRLPAIAQYLNVTVGYLLEGGAVEPRRTLDDGLENTVTPIPLSRLVPYVVAGTVEAGSFREVWEYDQSDPEVLYLEPDPDYPQARRFAALVAGDSMDDLRPLPILDGAKVVGVAYEDVAGRLPLNEGLVVVVQRERDAGHLREWSVKQITIEGNDIVFNPRSRNPKHKPFKVSTTFDADDGKSIEIIAVVRGVYNKIGL